MRQAPAAAVAARAGFRYLGGNAANLQSRELAPVAQLDRALPSEGRGHRFESCRVRHFLL